MKVLVTGGAGYIGSVCVEALCASGHRVVVLDNLSEGHVAAVDARAKLLTADLQDRAATSRAIGESGAEAVMHFAGSASVAESLADPSKYFRNNVVASTHLLEAAVAAGVRKVVFSSTCAVYGVPDSLPITEDLPLRPVTPYGESKLMVERMLRWHGEIHGLEWVALRYFNAAGATAQHGEHHRVETHLIPNVLKVALGQKDQCDICGTDYPTPDGTCIRDYVHVADLAQAHLLALTPGRGGCYNLGNSEGYSVRQVIAACERVTGRAIRTVQRPRRPGDPPRLVAHAQKAQTELGWAPRHASLDDIVMSAWAWHQQHPDGYAE